MNPTLCLTKVLLTSKPFLHILTFYWDKYLLLVNHTNDSMKESVTEKVDVNLFLWKEETYRAFTCINKFTNVYVYNTLIFV